MIDKIDQLCKKYAKDYDPEVLDIELHQPFFEITCASIKNIRRSLEDRYAVVSSLEHIFDVCKMTNKNFFLSFC